MMFLLTMLLHPFHASIAEAEWNRVSQRFEIAMRLDPRDFTTALSAMAKQRVDLESADTDGTRRIVMRYVNAKFNVKDQQDESARWHWVGLENETKFVWLYLELEPPKGANRLNLQNTMLFDAAPSQVNTMVFMRNDKRSAIHFSAKQPSSRLLRTEGSWQSAPRTESRD